MVYAALATFVIFGAFVIYHAVIALRNTNEDVRGSWWKALLAGPAAADELYSAKGRRHRDIAIALQVCGFILVAIFIALA